MKPSHAVSREPLWKPACSRVQYATHSRTATAPSGAMCDSNMWTSNAGSARAISRLAQSVFSPVTVPFASYVSLNVMSIPK